MKGRRIRSGDANHHQGQVGPELASMKGRPLRSGGAPG